MNEDKLQRILPSLIVIGLILLSCAGYSTYLAHKERGRFLSPIMERAANVRIIKGYHQGFLFQGYGDNGYLFEMEPDTLKVWRKVMRVTVRVPEEDKARILGELRHQWPLYSQEFDFDARTVELYQSEKYSGVIFVAYDMKTHRGVMRQYLSLMGGS